MYNREVETYLKSPKNDLGQLTGYPGIIDSYIQNYKDALDAEIQLKLELKNDENQRLLDDLAEQKSNWYTQMSYILSVANAEWKKAEQRLNNDRNTWEQEFVRVYDNKIEEWNQTYRDFSESKAEWVKEQYMKASQGKWEEATAEQDINRENIIQQVFLKTGLISKINDAVQNMAEETDSYIQGLTSSAIFKRSLEVAGSITDNIGAGIKHTKQGNTINTQNDTWLKEALESSKELEEHYEKISAKLTEQQMADQLRATIDGYMAQIDARNEGMRDWEESLVLQNGYSVNGNTIQREIIIDSTLTKNIKKKQSVYAYENFRVARPEQEISAGGSEDGKSLIESILDGIVNVKKWAEKIFGKAKDAKGNSVERTITKTKAGTDTRKNMENNNAQQLLEDYLKTAKEYDDNQEALKKNEDYIKYETIKDQIKDKDGAELKDWAKNNEEDNKTYNKVNGKIAQIQDGAINEWIGYAPTLKEGEEFKINKSKWENIEYEGKGQMGLIMLDFQWNSIEEQNGLAELAKPMYDKKMWDDDGAWLQPPTVRSIADIALDIVGNATGQKWLGWVDDALFGLMDVSGGYKTAQEVGLELGKKALTSVAGSAISAVGSLASSAADSIGNAFFKTATQAGIEAGQSYATSVASGYINAMYIDADGNFRYDTKTANSVWKDSLGSMASAGVTSFVTGGLNAVTSTDGLGKALNNKTFDTKNIGKFNTVAGKVAGGITEYAINGETSFNILTAVDLGLITLDNEKDLTDSATGTPKKKSFGELFMNNIKSNFVGKSDVGLFELKFSKKDGIQGKISKGGTMLGVKELAAAMQGMHDQTKIVSAKAGAIFGLEKGISSLNAVNGLSYSDDDFNLLLANEIWDGKKKLAFDIKGGSNDLGRSDENNRDVIHLSKDLLGNDAETMAKMASVIAHEGTHAYGNRIEGIAHQQGGLTYSNILQEYGLSGDQDFAKSIIYALNDPESWKENSGDVDYWKQVFENGQLGWREDGNLGFTFLTGDDKYLSPEEMKELINRYKEGQITKEAYLFKDEYDYWRDTIGVYKDFILNSEGFADASIAAEKLVKGNLSQSNIDDMNAGLYAAQKSGLLVENSYTAFLGNGLIGLGTIENPYLPLAGNVQITCLSGYRFVTEDFYNSLKKDSRKDFPLNEFAKNEHIHTDLISDNFTIVTSVDGAIKLNYDATWGLNGTNYSSDGNVAFLSNHMDPSSIKNYFSLFGMGGTSMKKANNGSYYLDGVKAGSVYGQMGQTGISGGKHVDFGIYQTKNPYRLNIHSDTRKNFESIFDFDSYNIKYQNDWVENFSGLPTNSIIDNYPAINKYLLNWTIRNIPNYSKVSYRG